MMKRGGRLRLDEKPSTPPRISDDRRRKSLQCDFTTETCVECAIYDAHPASADLIDDPVVQDHLAGGKRAHGIRGGLRPPSRPGRFTRGLVVGDQECFDFRQDVRVLRESFAKEGRAVIY